MAEYQGYLLFAKGQPLISKEKQYWNYFKLYGQFGNYELSDRPTTKKVYDYLIHQSQNGKFRIANKTIEENCNCARNASKHINYLDSVGIINKSESKKIIEINYDYINKIILSHPEIYRINFPNILEYNNGTFNILVKKFGEDIFEDFNLSNEERLMLFKLNVKNGKEYHFEKEEEEVLSSLEEKGYISFDREMKNLVVDF